MPTNVQMTLHDCDQLVQGIPIPPNITIDYSHSISSLPIDSEIPESLYRKKEHTNMCRAPSIMQGARVEFVDPAKKVEIDRILAMHAIGNFLCGSQRDAAIGKRYSGYPLKIMFLGGDGSMPPPDLFIVLATIPGCRENSIQAIAGYAKLLEFSLIDAGFFCLMRVRFDMYNPFPKALDSFRLAIGRDFPSMHLHVAMHVHGLLHSIGTDNASIDHAVEKNHLFVLSYECMAAAIDEFAQCMLYKRRNMPCGNKELCILHRNEVMLTGNPPNAHETEMLKVAIQHPLIFCHSLRAAVRYRNLSGRIDLPLEEWLDKTVYPQVGRGLTVKAMGFEEPGSLLHGEVVLEIIDRHESVGNSACTSYIVGYVAQLSEDLRTMVPSWSRLASPGGYDLLEDIVLHHRIREGTSASIIGDIKSPRDLAMALIASKDNPHSMYLIPRREIKTRYAQYLLKHEPDATHFVLFRWAGMLPLNLRDVETSTLALNTMLSRDNKRLRRPRFVDECFNPECTYVFRAHRGLCVPTARACLACGATFCPGCAPLLAGDGQEGGFLECCAHEHARKFVTRQIWPYDSDNLEDESMQVLGSLDLVCRLQVPLLKYRVSQCGYCHSNIEGKNSYCNCLFPVVYCNSICQQRDWKAHRKVCTGPPKSMRAAAKTILEALPPMDNWTFTTLGPMMRASASDVKDWRKNIDAIRIDIADCLSAERDAPHDDQ